MFINYRGADSHSYGTLLYAELSRTVRRSPVLRQIGMSIIYFIRARRSAMM